jgi:hypothetical protein
MASKRPKTSRDVSIEALRHQDKRANIPTAELQEFVADDEAAPQKLLYPRDPSLDPQLVWKGKDEQDQRDLEVPLVPIYIQEKIKSQAIIENLIAETSKGQPAQLDFFGDFNGLPEQFDKRVDFYKYEGNWQNRMILGDSLLVMASLADREGRPEGQGADDLHRPALRHPLRFKLAGEHAASGCPGRACRGRCPRAGSHSGLPGHVGDGHSLLFDLSA